MIFLYILVINHPKTLCSCSIFQVPDRRVVPVIDTLNWVNRCLVKATEQCVHRHRKRKPLSAPRMATARKLAKPVTFIPCQRQIVLGIGSGLLGRGRFSGCDGGLPLLAHQIRSVRYCRVSYATSELFIQEWPTHVTGTRRSHRLHRVNYHELPLCPMAGIDVTRDHWVPCPTNLLRARTSPVLAFLLSEGRREKKEQNNIF